MSKIKIYVVGSAKRYASFIKNHILVEKMEDSDIVLFTGGEDVNPEVYGHKPNQKSYFSKERDLREIKEFEKARMLGKGMVSICRGSQLITALSGGTLIQHVSNHAIAGTHKIKFLEDEKEMYITSTHHQMMNPFGLDESEYDLIAVSASKRSFTYEQSSPSDQALNMASEPEIVYYKAFKALAIQGHPEMMSKDEDVVIKINSLINTYLLANELTK